MSGDNEQRSALIYCTVCGSRSVRILDNAEDRKGEILPQLILSLTAEDADEIRRGRCIYCEGPMDVKWLDEEDED